VSSENHRAHGDDDPVQVVVRGTVIPIAWDFVGNPLGVAILTADEGEYKISPRGLGRRLFRCLTEEVVARIVPRSDRDGEPIADVVSFTRLSNHGDRGVPFSRDRGAGGGSPTGRQS
jgi:hypothetical protein